MLPDAIVVVAFLTSIVCPCMGSLELRLLIHVLKVYLMTFGRPHSSFSTSSCVPVTSEASKLAVHFFSLGVGLQPNRRVVKKENSKALYGIVTPSDCDHFDCLIRC